MGEPLDVRVYVLGDDAPTTSVYLLHGRGDGVDDWAPAVGVLDELVCSGRIPAIIAVMPDAPWSDRAGYWVDSIHQSGRPIESAMLLDLVPWIDQIFPGSRDASTRIVAGYSMGAAGALRYLAAHPRVFSSAIALSPAVYHPLPPAGSSARAHGAFGVGARSFDEDRYLALGFAPAVAAEPAARRLFVGFGDDEYRHADDPAHDVGRESAAVVDVARAAGAEVVLRAYPGGHNWGTWRPALRDGLLHMLSDRPDPE